MPHTKSAKKRLRQYEKRRLRNKATRKGVRLQVRKFAEAPKDASPDQLRQELKAAIKKLDKAAAKGVIHPNAAARKKSRLTRQLNQKSKAAKPS
ncbi:MAG: 30S ribosomal protein S20 [Gemmataceae bacterium]